jgi:hypothetical protein
MWITPSKKLTDESGLMLELGQRYFWKVQTNRTEGTYGTYRLKVWPIAEPEPAAWLLELAGTKASQAEGSLLLVAHHVDVSFGDIKVRPLDGDFAAPVPRARLNISATRVIHKRPFPIRLVQTTK